MHLDAKGFRLFALLGVLCGICEFVLCASISCVCAGWWLYELLLVFLFGFCLLVCTFLLFHLPPSLLSTTSLAPLGACVALDAKRAHVSFLYVIFPPIVSFVSDQAVGLWVVTKFCVVLEEG